VVPLDHGEHVRERPQVVVDAAAHALAVGAPRAGLDALGLLAPNVSLTLINAKDKAFDRTAAIYKLAGAEGKLKRK